MLVLIAPPGQLAATVVERVREAVHGAAPRWLGPGQAADIACVSPDRAAVMRAIAGDPVDALIVPDANRRKKLLVADMDSTIVQGETLDELASIAGLGQQVAAITKRSMEGELEFAMALRERVRLLQGADAALLERVPIRLTPGADALVATMRAHGAYTALASGGFTLLTARAATLAGFDAHHGNVLEIDRGRLTGTVREPVFDREAKAALLRHLAGMRGIDLRDTLAVGDGANDLAMLTAAGLGIAYRAKPVVTSAIANAVRHTDLTALLFAQGYAVDTWHRPRPPHVP